MERYPTDLKVSAEDFLNSSWKEVLASSQRQNYSGLWTALSAAAKKVMEAGDAKTGKVFWLLADACSMKLTPENISEPYKPTMVMEHRRSALPEDFTGQDLEFFAAIVGDIDNPWLKSRLADLLWLCRNPRDPSFALMAIDAYRELALDVDTWVRGSHEALERAIHLALMFGKGAGERLTEMVETIVTALSAATTEDGYLALWQSDVLYTNRLAGKQAPKIAEELRRLASAFDAVGDLNRCRDYSDRAANWFKRAGDDAKATEMTVAVAESWVKEAEERSSGQKASHMVAASFYENAIQVYRTIPRTERAAHRVDERMAELRECLRIVGEKSLSEMAVIRTPGTDISGLIRDAQNRVRDKDAIEAMRIFANLHHIDVNKIRKTVTEAMNEYPLAHLFPATVIDRDGRVIAKHAGADPRGESSDEQGGALWTQMVRHYEQTINLVVHGLILPAQSILIQQHRLREVDLVSLAKQSPIVPKDRAWLFGKALHAGFEHDYVTAIHLLAPQIENMVRVHLRAAGVTTTTLSQQGIESESGLSTLMASHEAERVFGSDLAFELKALYCDSIGPNLRNEVAHGLISHDECYSVYSVYAWWHGVGLVFNTYWNAAHKAKPSEPDSENGEAA